jgi:pilus assembly protein Flp/PilA
MGAFQFLATFAADDRGATAIEYGLIASLIAIAAIGAIQAVAGEMTDMYTLIHEALTAVL